mmetsp:Transcript_789/g.1190  ORF Transcript_789/g.1190 Transcript_789/m.1190 type:complete len:201 (-) Transcript_789:162-764(-)
MYLGSSTRPAAIKQLSRSCSATSVATARELGSSFRPCREWISGCEGLISSTCGGSWFEALVPALACSTIFIMRRRAPLSWSVTIAGESASRLVTRTSRTLSPSASVSQSQKSVAWSADSAGLFFFFSLLLSLFFFSSSSSASSFSFASSSLSASSPPRSIDDVSAEVRVRPPNSLTLDMTKSSIVLYSSRTSVSCALNVS